MRQRAKLIGSGKFASLGTTLKKQMVSKPVEGQVSVCGIILRYDVTLRDTLYLECFVIYVVLRFSANSLALQCEKSFFK